ncbi:uncharacterized protein LY89DRAFT_688641 [Mollisia scopiformis]|uniref:Zn(2)-C6 fungal-type domain-containing protein n=1 Tax=Mollisia scopiformis TaxID=149040 RepID=A0A194WW43_MOLSC|nr:uncharacterized protein LY89DRAFT_688641 [Mollisia scopiformis]KUJ12183.1 hypothetical protein LY89DRAFT_688641 [Mollisia scopiformis]
MSAPQNMLPPLGTVMVPQNVPAMAPMMHSTPPQQTQSSSNADSIRPQQTPHNPPSRPPPHPLDTMRAYRACLNCRNRKSKCDLDINRGRPPCRRCQRENRECVLGESHRGGRRVRKKPKLDEGATTTESNQNTPTNPSNAPFNSPAGSSTAPTHFSPLQNQSQQLPPPQPFHSRYDSRLEGAYGWQGTPNTAGSDTTSASRHTEQTNITSPAIDTAYRARQESTVSLAAKLGDRANEGIASADLQNPSDALEILAQVADRADDENSPEGGQTPGNSKSVRPVQRRQDPSPSKLDDYWLYKPIQDGMISPEMVYSLFSTYEEFFHPFFPIIPRQTFDRTRLPWLSRNEPHLFSAILTVASKDNERVHQICYDHMQQLVSDILAGADANVEAVEALLLLSQWVSHRPQASVAVGRGEEDRVAWMYIGTALRLGYFLGIDRAAFKSDSHEDPAIFNRKRLVWSACYICDRQVSVRLGKGFWARGPGPLSGLTASDFPTLQRTSPNDDDWALIFQANLELTQIFSNVHDILYSSKGHGWKEMLEGRYAKYLDDFRTSIRRWNDVWGTLICSSRLKASLLLTYDYLRLYVNAFAYQATISRAVTFHRDSQHNPNRPMPLISATAPDARFIYEALDAAKSLLSTFNNFVDPQTLRYMPSSYYLFIIYSAVFLYKARSTTTMTEEERTGVRHLINQTIERLQRASVGANHMGSRYARLLQLLWRKAPKRSGAPPHATIDSRLTNNTSAPSEPQQTFDQVTYPMQSQNFNGGGGGFSWLDLGATWNFATQNNGGNTNSSSGSAGDVGDGLADGVSPFDMNLLTDYSLLEGDNPNLIF